MDFSSQGGSEDLSKLLSQGLRRVIQGKMALRMSAMVVDAGINQSECWGPYIGFSRDNMRGHRAHYFVGDAYRVVVTGGLLPQMV